MASFTLMGLLPPLAVESEETSAAFSSSFPPSIELQASVCTPFSKRVTHDAKHVVERAS